MIDLRLRSIQQTGKLPNSILIDVGDEYNRDFLLRKVKSIEAYKDTYHVCLLGLSRLTYNDQMIDIYEYHSRLVRDFLCELERVGFSKVSFIEDGFDGIHATLLQLPELQMQDHNPEECFYCTREEGGSESGGMRQIGMFLNGFKKNLYQLANKALFQRIYTPWTRTGDEEQKTLFRA